MRAWRESRWANRSVVGAIAMLAAACSSSPEPAIPAFVAEDCRGDLVEIARLKNTYTVFQASGANTGNSLVLEGETLFMQYSFAGELSGLPRSGGIVAVPVSGGPARVVGAAENTSQWSTSAFWISGGRLYTQTGSEIRSYPVDADPPSTLPVVSSPRLYGAYAHDAEFGYAAAAENFKGVLVTKTALAGGPPTVLVDQPLENVSLGGMADAGDAVLLQVRWNPEPSYDGETFTRVWRIPKDGSAPSDVRRDVACGDPLGWSHWLASVGADILGSVTLQHNIVTARVSATGTAAPAYLKLGGGIAARRGDEILNVKALETRRTQGIVSHRVLVASSEGAPAGTVIACGGERSSWSEAKPVGLAANDAGIYVAYTDQDDMVIARVAQ